jgi:hypothetical protein
MPRSAAAVTCGMARLRGRIRLKSLSVVALAALAALTVSCGGSPSAGGGGSTTSSDRSTTTTTKAQATAVLAAYRAEQAAFEQAVQHADPTLPALAQTMTGAQLDSVRRSLVADQTNGIVGRGSVQIHPKVASIGGTQALVLDCAFDSSELVYVSTGKPVPPVTPPQKVAIRSNLTEVTPGVWKVADQSATDGSCPSDY